MSSVYLLVLLVLIGCMILLDRRWRLAFWRDARRAAISIAVVTAVLLVVDVIGIALGVFHRSTTWAMTGILLGPELPLEELFFLAFLAYLTLNLLAAGQLLRRRSER